jgi:ABC-type multidrug transport system permease subunit
MGGAVLYVQVGTLLGILIGAMVRNVELAVEIAPAIFVPLMLFSGYTNNSNNIVSWLKWLEYMSPVRYMFEFLVTNEFDDI